MKLRESGLVILLVVVVVGLIGYGSHKIFRGEHPSGKEEFRGHDNWLEEMGEGVVEKMLGLPEGSLDFTPISEEDIDKLDYPEEIATALKNFLEKKGKLQKSG